MADVDLFRDEYLPNIQAATITFAGWKKRYPAEFAAWVVYRDAVLAGDEFPELPAMSSKFGKALVAATQMAERNDMEVTLSTSGGTSNLSGTVTVTATVTPPVQATGTVKCEWYVDGSYVVTDTSYPLSFSWDTTAVATGSHVLRADVLVKNRVRKASLPVTVMHQGEPPPPPPPPIQDPPVNTTAPAISGTATEGQTLTVSTGVWTNSPTSYTRQWIRCDAAGANCVPIPSATGSSYVLVAADVGSTIRCAVTAYNSFGASAAVQTAQTAVVGALTPAVPVNVNLPVVSGTPTQGQSLGISNGSWTNAPTSYTYQWRRCDSAGAACANISGATSGYSYQLTATDVGKTIRCNVIAINGAGSSTAAASAATTVVIAPPQPPPAVLGVDRATMLATGGTILREDTSAATNPLPGLWGELAAVSSARHVHKTTGGSTHLRANGTAQGNTSYRELTVVNGDNYYGERCQLGRNESRYGENTGAATNGAFALYQEGMRRITFVSFRFPASFVMNLPNWQQILQFKQAQPYAENGPVNLAPALDIQIFNNLVQVINHWATLYTTAAPPANTWIRFAFDVTYSQDPTKGKFQMFVDNDGDGDFLDADEMSPVFTTRTLAYVVTQGGSPPGPAAGESIPGYLSLGIYHDPAVYGTTVIDVDNVQVVG